MKHFFSSFLPVYSLLFTVFYFILPHPVFAARSISFTTDKTSLKFDEEMRITASMSGFSQGEQIYIKGAFYKEGSTNYFGYTKYGDSWIKNSTKTTDQQQVVIGQWDGILIVKSDPSDSGFSESGNYGFKIGFYTTDSQGNPNAVDWSDTVVNIALEKPLPTNTPNPTPTRTPTAVPTTTPTALPTTTPTKKPTPTSPNVPTSGSSTPQAAQVLGVEQHVPTLAPSASDVYSPIPFSTIIPLVFVGTGTGLLSALGIWTTYQKNKKRNTI